MSRRRTTAALLAGACVPIFVGVVPMASRAAAAPADLSKVNHIVVIFEENRAFDNIYSGWPGVDGVSRSTVKQIGPDGAPLNCLPVTDVNLSVPPIEAKCTLDVPGGKQVQSGFDNAPFNIDQYIKREDTTCPYANKENEHGIRNGQGLPGGCEADLLHKYYQEQWQIDGGKMDRYAAGSDNAGLTISYHQTADLPIYKYLNSAGAPHHVVADRFFHAAFGGSYLNHQWLIAADTPVWPNAPKSGPDDLHSVVGPDGYPGKSLLHPQTPGTKDSFLTQAANPDGSCTVPAGGPTPPVGTVCGDYPVNTVQPMNWPYKPGTPDARRLPPLTNPTIGDRLSDKGVDWAYYAGGWDNATGNASGTGWTNGTGPKCADAHVDIKAVYPNCPDEWFQYHHQPFNYYARYAPGTPDRAAHLRDSTEFVAATKAGQLKPVSFVKPLGQENEHPGYTNEWKGSDNLVNLVKAVEEGPNAADTMVIVTYDEHGGLWDHVPPPTQPGISDKWGPGTRIPAMVISPLLPNAYAVDHTLHDTTSVMATMEHRFGLQPISSRDAAVADMSSVFDAAPRPLGATGRLKATTGAANESGGGGTDWARAALVAGVIVVVLAIGALAVRARRA